MDSDKPSAAKTEKTWGAGDVLKISAKAIIGTAVGVTCGMGLVAGAAALEGALLSYALFAKVLGIAGFAAGSAHGVSSTYEEKKGIRR